MSCISTVSLSLLVSNLCQYLLLPLRCCSACSAKATCYCVDISQPWREGLWGAAGKVEPWQNKSSSIFLPFRDQFILLQPAAELKELRPSEDRKISGVCRYKLAHIIFLKWDKHLETSYKQQLKIMPVQRKLSWEFAFTDLTRQGLTVSQHLEKWLELAAELKSPFWAITKETVKEKASRYSAGGKKDTEVIQVWTKHFWFFWDQLLLF